MYQSVAPWKNSEERLAGSGSKGGCRAQGPTRQAGSSGRKQVQELHTQGAWQGECSAEHHARATPGPPASLTHLSCRSLVW